MLEHTNSEQLTWGAKLNLGIPTRDTCPSWATPEQRQAWNIRGLVVWDDEQQMFLHLSPYDAFTLFQYWQAQRASRQEAARTIGRPAYETVWPNVAFKALDSKANKSPATFQAQVPAIMATPTERSSNSLILAEPIELTAAQAERVYALLNEHHAALQEAAEAEKLSCNESVRRQVGKLWRLVSIHAAKNIDLTTRSLPWLFDERANIWACDLPPNRGTVRPTLNGLAWQGIVERPQRLKQESPIIGDFEKALTWVEQAFHEAELENRNAPASPPKVARLTLSALTEAHRRRLAPFWIEPKALEPAQLTYRAMLRLSHIHIRAKELEISFGEKWYLSTEYPSIVQIAQRFNLSSDRVDIETAEGTGWYLVQSKTAYVDKSLAIAQAERLWEQSGIASALWESQVIGACFGIVEVETGYTYVLGGIREWPEKPQAREKYLAERAFELTLIHALDVEGKRATSPKVFAKMNDEEILISLHRGRVAADYIPSRAKEESRQWLLARGLPMEPA